MKRIKKIPLFLLVMCFVFAGVLANTDSIYARKITSAKEAEKKALQKVKNAVVTDVEKDHENGELVYEVELLKGSKEYDIAYRISDGKPIAFKWKKHSVNADESKSLIGKAKCKKLAQQKVKNGKITSIKSGSDDGISVYKVKLTAGNKKYTLKYHARNGALLSCGWKLAS